MKMTFDTYELTDGRKIIFEERDQLLILQKNDIDMPVMEDLKEYLYYFPETIYVEQDGIVAGIITNGDVSRSLLNHEVMINNGFFRIDSISKVSKEYLENFFDEHFQIRSVPVVLDGQLRGQYTLIYSENSNGRKIRWNPLKRDFLNFCEKNSIYNIAISKCEQLITMIKNMQIKKELVLRSGKEIEVSFDENKNADELVVFSDMQLKSYLTKRLNNHDEIKVKYISEQDLYMECLISHISQKCNENDVKLLFVEPPVASKIKDIGEKYKNALKQRKSLEEIADDETLLMDIYGDNEDSFQFVKNKEFHNFRFLSQGLYCNLMDYQSKNMNVVGGKRITCNQPKNHENRIWFFGTCLARGAYVADSDTIESMLQRRINETYPDTFEVVNCGVAGRVGNEMNDFHYIMDTELRQGDIVICMAQYNDKTIRMLKDNGVACYELSTLFEQPNELGRWFLDIVIHVNHRANEVIADYLYKELGGIFADVARKKEKERKYFVLGDDSEDDLEGDYKNQIQDYIGQTLDEIKKYTDTLDIDYDENNMSDRIGSIVMNCNPFTLGHRYLIENCAGKVDLLIVFVVQEDSSVFPFKDRYDLVKKGTKDIKNVLVIPSGKFMISSETFPEYFDKSHLQDIQIDSSKDVRVFGKYIAPNLGIGIRFVGSEPMDKVTDSYNKALAGILPRYGVKLLEIERKVQNGEAISASRVRKLISDGRFDELDDLVPSTTKEYLLEKYGK
ncbi:MAG: adenylyltransferase/cytidyltransferase family protein [Lachnospiraceae bacterium]|nr:adenylyltransferase/cytidyltransferase family protein [Lachnospiraceae bacterium]